MTVELEVVADPAGVCAAMMLSAAVGGGQIVLTGGSTPRAAYAELARSVRNVGLDLHRTTFWLGDERCVEPDDDRCNFKMIRQSLLDPLADVTRPTVHRLEAELGPRRGAEDYARQLLEAGPPEFDLVLLGIGPDGHTASLFPGQDTLAERSRLVVGVPEAGLEPFVSRVSLTLPALTSGVHLVVLATGEAKADAVAAAFAPGAQPDPRVPASLLAPAARRVTVLLDRAAAAGLDGGGTP